MISNLLDIIAPESCLECGQEGFIWCDWCRLQAEPLPSRCFLCHAQTDNFVTCRACRPKTRLRRVYVLNEYKDTAQQLIHAMKFDCKRHASKPIAATMVEILPFYQEGITVVNVPTSPARVRQRGFDHTKLLAKAIARRKKLKFESLLIRVNDLRQVGASREQRARQIEGAFRLKAHKSVSGQSILLVDDVVTTGATLNEAAKVLKQMGAKSVDAIVFAYSK